MHAAHKSAALAGALACAVALTACSGNDEDTAAPAETVTVTTPASPVEPSTPPPAPATTEAVDEPAAPTKADDSTSFKMPNVVGMNLQRAQDHLQKVSGNPLYYSTSHDVSGEDRMQLWDRSWKVCTQNVKAGKTVTENKTVDLGVVKNGERC